MSFLRSLSNHRLSYVFKEGEEAQEVKKEEKKFVPFVPSGPCYLQEKLPVEILLKIFNYFNPSDLSKIRELNSYFNHVANDPSIKFSMGSNFVAEKEWKILGTTEKLSLSKSILKILYSPCPFSPEKPTYLTHTIILITKVNGEYPMPNWPTQLGEQAIPVKINSAFKKVSTIAKPYLCLITEIEEAKIQKKAEIAKLYREPNALEGVTYLAMKLLYKGERPFLRRLFYISEKNGPQGFAIKQSEEGIALVTRRSDDLFYLSSLSVRTIPLE